MSVAKLIEDVFSDREGSWEGRAWGYKNLFIPINTFLQLYLGKLPFYSDQIFRRRFVIPREM